MYKKIKINMIKCNHCGDIIVSESVHDFRFCSCGTVAVDGGNEYLRKTFKNSKDDLIEVKVYSI